MKKRKVSLSLLFAFGITSAVITGTVAQACSPANSNSAAQILQIFREVNTYSQQPQTENQRSIVAFFERAIAKEFPSVTGDTLTGLFFSAPNTSLVINENGLLTIRQNAISARFRNNEGGFSFFNNAVRELTITNVFLLGATLDFSTSSLSGIQNNTENENNALSALNGLSRYSLFDRSTLSTNALLLLTAIEARVANGEAQYVSFFEGVFASTNTEGAVSLTVNSFPENETGFVAAFPNTTANDGIPQAWSSPSGRIFTISNVVVGDDGRINISNPMASIGPNQSFSPDNRATSVLRDLFLFRTGGITPGEGSSAANFFQAITFKLQVVQNATNATATFLQFTNQGVAFDSSNMGNIIFVSRGGTKAIIEQENISLRSALFGLPSLPISITADFEFSVSFSQGETVAGVQLVSDPFSFISDEEIIREALFLLNGTQGIPFPFFLFLLYQTLEIIVRTILDDFGAQLEEISIPNLSRNEIIFSSDQLEATIPAFRPFILNVGSGGTQRTIVSTSNVDIRFSFFTDRVPASIIFLDPGVFVLQ